MRGIATIVVAITLAACFAYLSRMHDTIVALIIYMAPFLLIATLQVWFQPKDLRCFFALVVCGGLVLIVHAWFLYDVYFRSKPGANIGLGLVLVFGLPICCFFSILVVWEIFAKRSRLKGPN